MAEITLKRPLSEKLRGAVSDSSDERCNERLREYERLIMDAIANGDAALAANLSWEAAHCWLNDVDA